MLMGFLSFPFMVLPFFCPATLILELRGSGRGEEPSGGNVLRLIQIRLATLSLQKISLVCQGKSAQLQIADSSSKNAASFSSARTTKRFPSPRCASAIQIVRPSESIAETQPLTPTGFAELIGYHFPLAHFEIVPVLVSTQQSQNDMKGRNDAGDKRKWSSTSSEAHHRFARLAHALLANSSHCERMLSASATDIALASFMTSDGTQVGKRFCFDWCVPLAVCSFHTLASCSSRNWEASLTNAGQRRRCTYVILPPISLQTRMLGFSQIASAARKISFPFGWPHQLSRMGPPAIASARFGKGPRAAWSTIP
jgi:hypothetical protein